MEAKRTGLWKPRQLLDPCTWKQAEQLWLSQRAEEQGWAGEHPIGGAVGALGLTLPDHLFLSGDSRLPFREICKLATRFGCQVVSRHRCGQPLLELLFSLFDSVYWIPTMCSHPSSTPRAVTTMTKGRPSCKELRFCAGAKGAYPRLGTRVSIPAWTGTVLLPPAGQNSVLGCAAWTLATDQMLASLFTNFWLLNNSRLYSQNLQF